MSLLSPPRLRIRHVDSDTVRPASACLRPHELLPRLRPASDWLPAPFAPIERACIWRLGSSPVLFRDSEKTASQARCDDDAAVPAQSLRTARSGPAPILRRQAAA